MHGPPGEEPWEAPGIHRAVAKLEVIQDQLGLLRRQFETKLKYDAHKERIIDHLHHELQECKGALFSRQEHSMAMDMIKIIDDIRKFTGHYRSLEPGGRSPEKPLEFLEQIPSDIEDLFMLRGITAFQGESFSLDPARQRIVRRIATADPLRDRTIAASLRPGYERDGRVLRPEMVAVYVYEPAGGEVEARSGNE